MIITYVRHLESLANTRRGFCYENDEHRNHLNLPSDNDVSLTQQGIKHGKRLEKEFSKIQLFDPGEMDMYVSPYRRTIQTSEILFPQFANQIKTDTRLCERYSGYCENMTQEEIEKYFPWLQGYWDRTHPLLATPPGGECMLDVVHRVRPVIAEAIASGRNHCFVAHGNLFKAFDFILRNMLFEDFSKIPNAPNGSLTIYRNVQLGSRGTTIDMYHKVLCE